jgi:AraC-like DNA-binding protein
MAWCYIKFATIRMLVNTFTPSATLSPFVERYVIVESALERVNRLLPDTSIAMAFRLRGHTEYINKNSSTPLPSSVVSGLRKTPRLVSYSPGSATLIVLFKTSGASAFFRQPLHTLFEENVALKEVINYSSVQRAEDELAVCSDHCHRIKVIEQFLLSQLHLISDPLIANALSRINAATGNLRIKTLAESLHLSQDAFEKRFRKAVGSTAKQFSMILRMKSVTHFGKKANVTNLALAAGYFDSAHFNKEFKLFTGQTPSEFFSKAPAW